MHSLKEPVTRVIATKLSDFCVVDGNSSDELDMELLISKHARVMLTSNLWIEAGLVNGALGYVEEIVYRPGHAPPELPLYIMVKFDNYSRFPFNNVDSKIVPICVVQRGSTTQIPLRLAWALTIHKSQGLTLEKATIDIGPTERIGLTFVAISRIKSLQGLRIMPPIPYDHYEKMKKSKQLEKRKAEERRLQLLEVNLQ